MGDHQDQDAVIERRPAKNVVLAQSPVAMQALLEMDEIAALPETHLLSQAGQLIQVRRIVGYAPNPRWRQIF